MKQRDADREKAVEARESNRELRNRCCRSLCPVLHAPAECMRSLRAVTCTRIIAQDKQLALAKRTIERLSFERVSLEVGVLAAMHSS